MSSSPRMWSACPWVKTIASTRRMPNASDCARTSGPASTSTPCPSSVSTYTDARHRLSRGSAERHVSQSQPIIGTPCDVPVPRNVMRKGVLWLDDALLALLRLHVADPQFVEQIVDETRFGFDQVAFGLLLQHGDELDHLRRSLQVGCRLVAGGRVGDVAEVHCGRGRERQDEAAERDTGIGRLHSRMLA